MYLRASAALLAEKTVVAYSLAQASSFSKSSPVAPLIADTSDMVLVKFWPNSMTFPTRFLIPSTARMIASAARFANVALNMVKPSSAFLAELSTSSRELSNLSAAYSASESLVLFSCSSLDRSWICRASSRASSLVSPCSVATSTYRCFNCWRVSSCLEIVERSVSASPPASSMVSDRARAAFSAASNVPRFSVSSPDSSWIVLASCSASSVPSWPVTM